MNVGEVNQARGNLAAADAAAAPITTMNQAQQELKRLTDNNSISGDLKAKIEYALEVMFREDLGILDLHGTDHLKNQ